ncbi:MAG: hypothetical protein WBL79_06050, partial [Bacillota bacterium]
PANPPIKYYGKERRCNTIDASCRFHLPRHSAVHKARDPLSCHVCLVKMIDFVGLDNITSDPNDRQAFAPAKTPYNHRRYLRVFIAQDM